MPFIGRDWRSPGEQWVKTHKGSWERLKLLDNAAQFLGFQSSDSSSLDSDSSSISDNEASGLTFNLMESESSANQQEKLEENLVDIKNELSTELNENVLKENVFLLNSNSKLNQQNNLIDSTSSSSNDDEETSKFRPKCITTLTKSNAQAQDEYTITEFNTTNKRNTSIQNIISQYELKQQIPIGSVVRKTNRLQKQTSFDEVKKPTFLKSIKQKHLFPSKSIDQPMLDLEQSDDQQQQLDSQQTSKFSFVRKNFEKLLNPLNTLNQMKQKDDKKCVYSNKITIHEKQIEKPTKHLTIKQCIRKIDLNTTHQNIIKHLEDNVSLNQESSYSKQSIRTNKSSNELTQLNSQPYCPIILKHTKEIAGYNSLAETFLRLDFYNAIRDIRRFNYVCKLLHLLITQNLTSLSGCATKFLFNLLEEIAFQVAGNQQNLHVLHTLLRDVQKIMKKYYCWGRPIGSTVLWEAHLKTIENICQIVKNIEIKPPPKDGKGFRDLPAELIRTILCQLSDYKDLMSSGQVNDTMKSFLDEQYIWRELCKYHFSNRQIKQFLKDIQGNKNYILEKPINEKLRRSNADNLNWEKVFHSLRKKFGLKEEYADSLFLCRHCRSLFWKYLGHPCQSKQMIEEMNKENTEGRNSQLISNENNNNSRPNDAQPPPQQQRRIVQVRPSMNQLINNQIDLNRQINNLNRVNNNIVNNEIRQAANDRPVNEERQQISVCGDSVPISPEAFLKFFSL